MTERGWPIKTPSETELEDIIEHVFGVDESGRKTTFEKVAWMFSFSAATVEHDLADPFVCESIRVVGSKPRRQRSIRFTVKQERASIGPFLLRVRDLMVFELPKPFMLVPGKVKGLIEGSAEVHLEGWVLRRRSDENKDCV